MNRKTLERVAFGLLCFAFPVVLLAVSCALSNVYPFGENTFLAEDLRYQYRDFYEWFIRVLGGQASVLYNPFTGMGTNAWGIYSYYLASPVNFLLPLFGPDRITLFVYVATSIKLGLMGVCATWYLRRRFDLRRAPALALAMCYTWSTWTVTQMRNPQWLDALVLLPLMAWSVYALFKSSRRLPLIVVIALAVVACWYTAYMLMAYLFLLFVMEAVAFSAPGEQGSGMPLRTIVRRAGWLVVCIVAGLGIASFTFVPTVLQMLSTNAPAVTYPPINVPLEQVMQGTVLRGWALGDIPQLFGGTLLLVLLFSLPFARSVPVRVRVVAILVVVFLVYCTKGVTMQIAWSGFRPATGFYNRMSWLAIFSMLWAGAWVVRGLQRGEVAVPVLAIGAGLTCAWAIIVFFVSGFDSKAALAIMVLVALLSAAALVFATGVRQLNGSVGVYMGGVALCALVVLELGFSGVDCVRVLYSDQLESRIMGYVDEAREQASELREFDGSWYRADKTYTREGYAARNDGMAYGYYALSTYCSSQNGKAVAFLERMGYSKENEFSVSYESAIPPMDSALGVRYVSTGACPATYEDVGLMTVGADTSCEATGQMQHIDVRFFQNPLSLSIAYGVDDGMHDAGYVAESNPFAEQNALFSKMLGREVELYKPVEATPVEQTHVQRSWDVKVPQGFVGYVYSVPAAAWCTMSVGDRTFDDNMRWRYAVSEVADAREEEKTERVTIAYAPAIAADPSAVPPIDEKDECRFYALDWAEYEQVMAELAQHQAQVGEFSSGSVDLTYEADKDGLLLVSLPNEPGWSAKVNGEKVELQGAYDGALMLVPVTKGQNHVELNFVPRGLVPGCVVSMVAITATAACVLAKRHFRAA